MMMKTDEAKIKNSPLYPFFYLNCYCYAIASLHYTTPLVILTMIYITTDELHVTYLTLLARQLVSEEVRTSS